MKKKEIDSICSFSLKEKIFAQFSFNAGVLVGAYGVFLSNKILGIAYLLYSYIGIVLLMRYTVCPRCPHLHVANDCLQLHPSITKIIISPNRKGALSIIEKILFLIVLYGILLLPIYWIASKTIILVFFLLFYGGLLLTMHLHLCPNCQNKSCVQNRNRNLIEMPKIG